MQSASFWNWNNELPNFVSYTEDGKNKPPVCARQTFNSLLSTIRCCHSLSTTLSVLHATPRAPIRTFSCTKKCLVTHRRGAIVNCGLNRPHWPSTINLQRDIELPGSIIDALLFVLSFVLQSQYRNNVSIKTYYNAIHARIK